MNPFSTLYKWASDAWNTVSQDVSGRLAELQKIWHYVTSVYSAFAWLFARPATDFWKAVLAIGRVIQWALDGMADALWRVGAWIWLHEVVPVRGKLQHEINALRAWALREFLATWALIALRYRQSLAYTRAQVGVERAQRIKAIQVEHAAMLAGDKATLATVQKQAATAYAAGIHARLGAPGDLLRDLVTRTPVVADLVNYVIDGALDLADVENPVLGLLLTKAVNEIVSKVGVDQVAAQAAADLLAPIIGQPPPKTLSAVITDIDQRLTAMERNWAKFMQAGGPEVEQAGDQWKGITSLAADVALVGQTVLAVEDPSAWATGISDTVGEVANGALTGIVALIGKV